ncbi:hypothetical protein BV97_03953 [Novosphingobium resinovorum]|uniref:Uncharacterized protein n=1 Tax=Novosphingobium resinovorum TaxID=158500 RepID=A0A031JP17_9SPHN|nr:hypothetical protein [Novosphingobium resinovorum]EZP79516.1 hypothetical protein BV97_03953 [Novosphingobium resinovorum]
MEPEENRWMSAREAYELTARHYSQAAAYEGDGLSDVVSNILLGKMYSGLVPATASFFEWGRINGRLRKWIVAYKLEEGIVPREFWKEMHVVGASSSIDWMSGDFHFSSQAQGFWKHHWIGGATGTKLDRAAFEQAVLADLRPAPLSALNEQTEPARAGGRKPSNWWPDVAEELAILIHEQGLPESQEALIAAIQSAVTAKGKPEPSRSQLQPVVRSIFSRIKEAGN